MSDDNRDERATLVTLHTGPHSLPVKMGPLAACLVVIYGTDLGRRIPIGEEALDCGRSAQAGIPIDDDAASRRHARFQRQGNMVVVSDLTSTNGTFVNDTQITERPLVDGDRVQIGRTIFKFIQGSDIEFLYHEQIYRVMTFDGLTQVHNRRTFDATLEREISRAKRYGRPLSLIAFDIDHFKRINDTHGHVAGDAVLRQVASVVSANVRREDTVARTGGEEMAVLAPEVPYSTAITVAEKLRGLIERSPCAFEQQQIRVTASFGVAAFSGDPQMSAADLYRAADERLYEAKHNGRNRVA